MRKRKRAGGSKKRPLLRKLRKVLIWILIILIIFIGALVTLSYYYGNQIVKKFLITTVSQNSKGVYKLNINSLYFNLLNGRINISGFDLVPDTVQYNRLQVIDTLSPMLFELHINRFQVQGLDVQRLVREKALFISRILIDKPDVRVIVKRSSVKRDKPSSATRMLSIPLPKGFTAINIREISLKRGKLVFDNRSTATHEKYSIPFLEVTITNTLIDPLHQGRERIFNSDDIKVTLRGIKVKTKNRMYTIIPGEVGFSTGSSTAWIKDFHLLPGYSRYAFCRKAGYQVDRMDISVKRINIHRLDMRSLILQQKMIAGLVTIDGLNVENYRNKRIPVRPGFIPLLPQQALLKSKTYLKIDSVKITTGKITYSEQVNNEPGSIFFNKISGTVVNITNDSLLIRKKPMRVNASMFLMGKGRLEAKINFPLGERKDAFTFSAILSQMDLREINPMLTRLVPAEITSGSVVKMVIENVNADDDKAIGRMEFYYQDLTLKLNSEKGNLWSKVKTGVLNIAANAYVANSNPRKNGSFSEGIIYFERDKHKGIFNFLWKSAFSGIKSTIGINKKEQKEIKKAKGK